jgi:hypothetical protein
MGGGGGGLYPPNLERPPIFLLPSVCHMPMGWCRRTLTESEEWMLYDVPYWVVASLKYLTSDARRAHYSAILHGRCLQEGLRLVLKGLDLMDEGGGLRFRSIGDISTWRESVNADDIYPEKEGVEEDPSCNGQSGEDACNGQSGEADAWRAFDVPIPTTFEGPIPTMFNEPSPATYDGTIRGATTDTFRTFPTL